MRVDYEGDTVENLKVFSTVEAADAYADKIQAQLRINAYTNEWVEIEEFTVED